MTTPSEWPRDKLTRFWALQKAARHVGLKLTAEGDALSLRTAEGAQSALADLDEAEAAIAATDERSAAK